MFPGALILFSGLVQDVTMNILVHTKSFDFFVKLGVWKKVKSAPLMRWCVHNVVGLARLNVIISAGPLDTTRTCQYNMEITEVNYTECSCTCIFSND